MTNMELYHYGVKGMRWGRRKADLRCLLPHEWHDAGRL